MKHIVFILILLAACSKRIGNLKVGASAGLQFITVSAPNINVPEGDSAALVLSFSAPAPSNFQMTWSLAGTDLAGNFPAALGVINVDKNDTSVTASIGTLENLLVDGNRSFSLTLSSTPAGVMETKVVTFTILDDDIVSFPTLSVSDASVSEGTGIGSTTLDFTVTLAALSGVDVIVDYATSDGTATLADSDYSDTSGTLTIPAGSASGTISVPITHDPVKEPAETLTLTLSGGSNYEAVGSDLIATGTITNDDDDPAISIANVSLTEGTGGGPTIFTFTATLSALSPDPVVVNYATSDGSATVADGDYATNSGTLTIPAGSLSGTFDVSVLHDSKYEPDEAFTVTLSGGSGYHVASSTLTASGTIENDDTQPTVQWSVASSSAGENAGTAILTLSLSSSSGLPVTVPYTLSGTGTSPADYSITASPVTIPAGSLSTTVTVTIVDDSSVEGDETVIATIGTPTNATVGTNGAHTLTILDNDFGAFSIAGVRSANGLDVTTDQYLNYGTAPRFLYSAASGASSYDVTVLENDLVTVRCALQNTALTTFDPSSCNLTPGDSYRLIVRARNAAGFGADASNSMYPFTYNRAPVISTRGTWNFSPGVAGVFNVIADDPATGSFDPATDADGDSLSVASVTAATNGTSAVNSSTTIRYTPNSGYDGQDSFTVTISDGRGATATATVNVSSIAPYRWIGGGVDSNWNTFSNWCGTVGGGGAGSCQGNASSAPGVNDVAIFDSSCIQCNSTINIPLTVKGIEMRSGYTGTLTQNAAANLVVQLGGWKLDAGSFVGSSNAATNVTLQGGLFELGAAGTFTAPRGILTINSNDAASFTRTNLPLAATQVHKFFGNFVHNSGTVVFTGSFASGSVAGSKMAEINIASSVDFNHLTINYFNSSTTPTGASSPYLTFLETADKINVLGDLTFTSGSISQGLIDVSGNILANCSANIPVRSSQLGSIP